jgi:uncharacterized membrane protein
VSARSRREERRKASGRPAKSRGPDRVLLTLSIAGMALAGYLSVTGWLGASPLYCSEGSACDVAQSSRWGSLLGLPMALWGFFGFAALGRTALLRKPELRFGWTWLLSLCGVSISAYLTAISLFHLGVTCAYCLASSALWVAAFAVVIARRPKLPGMAWRPWLAWTGGLAAASVVALHAYHAGLSLSPPVEDPYLRALATHLAKTGARFYGTSWCDHCREQKEHFGESAHRLPYVECSPAGRNRPTSAVCREAGVRSYPTWDIDGTRHLGTLTPARLAELTRFVPE